MGEASDGRSFRRMPTIGSPHPLFMYLMHLHLRGGGDAFSHSAQCTQCALFPTHFPKHTRTHTHTNKRNTLPDSPDPHTLHGPPHATHSMPKTKRFSLFHWYPKHPIQSTSKTKRCISDVRCWPQALGTRALGHLNAARLQDFKTSRQLK